MNNIGIIKKDELGAYSVTKLENVAPKLITKHKDTKGKPKLSLVPLFPISKAIWEVRKYGNNKYPNGGPDNWKTVPKEEYKEAITRHTIKWSDGEWLDEESGLPHIYHIACNVAFYLWLHMKGKLK